MTSAAAPASAVSYQGQHGSARGEARHVAEGHRRASRLDRPASASCTRSSWRSWLRPLNTFDGERLERPAELGLLRMTEAGRATRYEVIR